MHDRKPMNLSAQERKQKLKEFEQQVVRDLPQVRWREPLMVRTFHSNHSYFGCRLCIGAFGLLGGEVPALPATRAEYDQHMQEWHP